MRRLCTGDPFQILLIQINKMSESIGIELICIDIQLGVLRDRHDLRVGLRKFLNDLRMWLDRTIRAYETKETLMTGILAGRHIPQFRDIIGVALQHGTSRAAVLQLGKHQT
jgi:hypothetical protein